MEEQYIQQINAKHDKAMEFAALADLAQIRGNPDESQKLYRQSFEMEREVALEIAPTKLEPSRSVLFRSAASLALICGEIREAEKLAATGLAGDPPEVIAKELRTVLRLVFDRLAEKAIGG